MDDESELLGAPESPETARKRVFDIMECLATGKSMEALTEKEIKNVEEALKKIQEGVAAAKKSMLTDEDILNVANLNVFSPAPSSTNVVAPQDNYDFSSPLRDKMEEDDDDLQLDYEESIGGGTDSEEARMEEGEDIMEISRNSMDNEKSELPGQKPLKRKSTERDTKPPGISSPKREMSVPVKQMSGLRLVSSLTSPVRPEILHPKLEDDDVIFLSSDSETDSDTLKIGVPKKRQRIVYDSNNTKVKAEKGFDADDECDDNVSKANFSKKLTKEQPYLKLRESRMTVDSKKLGLTYPLGVTFDKPTDMWFITNIPYQQEGHNCDNGQSKVVKIYVGKSKKARKYTDIEDKSIENPMAITVYEEGSKIALLCSDNSKRPWICLINHRRDDKVSTFCSYRNSDLDFSHPSRGLARTKGGNLLTTDRPVHCPPRLRIFSKRSSGRVEEVTYLLKNADLPCFVASSDDTVVITDLGQTQTVMQMKIDDSDWRNVKFEMIRIIKTTGVNFRAEEMLNNEYFIYVSGVQIDRNGNIIVADAKNHHFKLFHPSMKFINRISTDFPVPYVSSFHVNQHGECLILSTRETKKVHFAKLTSSNRVEKHIKSGAGGRIGMRNPLSSKRRTFAKDTD